MQRVGLLYKRSPGSLFHAATEFNCSNKRNQTAAVYRTRVTHSQQEFEYTTKWDIYHCLRMHRLQHGG